jgi:hypothetical protein
MLLLREEKKDLLLHVLENHIKNQQNRIEHHKEVINHIDLSINHNFLKENQDHKKHILLHQFKNLRYKK